MDWLVYRVRYPWSEESLWTALTRIKKKLVKTAQRLKRKEGNKKPSSKNKKKEYKKYLELRAKLMQKSKSSRLWKESDDLDWLMKDK